MSAEKQQQQQQPQSLQTRQVAVFWEGESLAVKSIARQSRLVLTEIGAFLRAALYFPGATEAASQTLTRIDDGVHHSSALVAQYLNRTSPWLPYASITVTTALLATIKSNHYWGPVAAGRNGFLALAATSLFFFPNEIREALGEAAASAKARATGSSSAVEEGK